MVTLKKVSKSKRKFGFLFYLNPQSDFFKVCPNFKSRTSGHFYVTFSRKLYIC